MSKAETPLSVEIGLLITSRTSRDMKGIADGLEALMRVAGGMIAGVADSVGGPDMSRKLAKHFCGGVQAAVEVVLTHKEKGGN